MKSSPLLSASLVLLLSALPLVPVHAQTDAGGVDDRKANTRGARRAADAKAHAATNQAPLYPNATRESPVQSGDKSMAKKMEALFKLQEQPDSEDKVIAAADEVLASPKANAFDKSSAA